MTRLKEALLLLLLLPPLALQQLRGDYETNCTDRRVYKLGTDCVYCNCEGNTTVCSPKGPCSCRYLGRSYPEGTVWRAPHDPCSKLICHDGIVTWYRVGCPCHRRGPKCRWNTSEMDPCARDACPVLDCLPEHQLKREGQCCPVCNPEEKSNMTSSPLFHCRFRGIDHEVGHEFRVDACTQCICMKGGLQCRRHVCSFLPSPLSSQCCQANCRVDNQGKLVIRRYEECSLENGTQWHSRSTVCTCLNGRITCESLKKDESVSCYSMDGSLRGVGDSLLITPSCHYHLLVRNGLTLILHVSSENIPSLYLILREFDHRVVVVFSSYNGEATVSVREPNRITQVDKPPFVRFDPPGFNMHTNNLKYILFKNDVKVQWNGRDFNVTSKALNGTGICLSSPSNKFARGKICSKNQYSFPFFHDLP